MVVTYTTDGKRKVKLVRLNRGGDGRTKVAFSSRSVAAVFGPYLDSLIGAAR